MHISKKKKQRGHCMLPSKNILCPSKMLSAHVTTLNLYNQVAVCSHHQPFLFLLPCLTTRPYIFLHVVVYLSSYHEKAINAIYKLAKKLPAICLPHQEGDIPQVSFPTAQQVNLPVCSPHCPFNAERQAGKL